MTSQEIKHGLGAGALAEIARELEVTKAHVSQVVWGKRRSPRVEKAVAKRLRRKAADVFPVRTASLADVLAGAA